MLQPDTLLLLLLLDLLLTVATATSHIAIARARRVGGCGGTELRGEGRLLVRGSTCEHTKVR